MVTYADDNNSCERCKEIMSKRDIIGNLFGSHGNLAKASADLFVSFGDTPDQRKLRQDDTDHPEKRQLIAGVGTTAFLALDDAVSNIRARRRNKTNGGGELTTHGIISQISDEDENVGLDEREREIVARSMNGSFVMQEIITGNSRGVVGAEYVAVQDIKPNTRAFDQRLAYGQQVAQFVIEQVGR